MFDQMFENLRRGTEFNIRTQQRMFKKWACLWGVPASPNSAGEQITKAQEKWTEFVTDLVKRQRETLEPQFRNSLKIVEEACTLVEAKDPEELRAKTIKLWQQSFDCLWHVCEAELCDFETAVAKWLEIVTSGAMPGTGPIPEDVEAPSAYCAVR